MSFLTRGRKIVDLDRRGGGKKLGGVEGGGYNQKILYEKKSIFSKKREKISFSKRTGFTHAKTL